MLRTQDATGQAAYAPPAPTAAPPVPTPPPATSMRHPEQWRKLIANPALIGTAVEEIARFDTAVPFLFRIAKQDLTIGDRWVPAGSVVALGLGAANHDPAVFGDPDRVDIARKHSAHLTFGYGPRYCIGAPLARLELKTALGELIPRFPTMRVTVDPATLAMRCDALAGGLLELPVTWLPPSAEALGGGDLNRRLPVVA